jgi:SAM-dependent methyltransferase
MEVQQLYQSGQYLENNPTYHVEDSPWKAQQILRMLARHNLRVQSVGEVGCGAGEILRQLQPHFAAETVFHGYEISPQAFALCKQRENERLHFYCEDLLAKETDPFDLLLCLDVFEHVEDYLGFLRKLRDRAVYKIFHIPLDLSVQSVLRCTPIVTGRVAAGHLHYFLKETALLTLQDTGYETLDWFYTPALDRGTTLKARIAKWPRKLLALLSQDWAARLLGGYSLLVLTK